MCGRHHTSTLWRFLGGSDHVQRVGRLWWVLGADNEAYVSVCPKCFLAFEVEAAVEEFRARLEEAAQEFEREPASGALATAPAAATALVRRGGADRACLGAAC